MRKNLVTGIAAGALGAGLLGSAALAESPPPSTTTAPQPPNTPQQSDTNDQRSEPAYTGTITVPQNTTSDGAETQESAALASLATITQGQARTAALRRFPGATISAVSLDDENGVLVWSVELVDATGAGQDVKVDAGNAAILNVQAGGSDGAESGSPAGGESGTED